MRLIFSFIFLIYFISSSFSLPLVIKRLDVELGLSNNEVVGITQDKSGFIWCATEEGLNRFDGNKFQPFYKDTKGGIQISGNELSCVYGDKYRDIVWVGTQRNGLNAIHFKGDSTVTYIHNPNNQFSIGSNEITLIKNSKSGNLWIGTYYNGLELLDCSTGLFTHLNKTTVPSLISNNVSALTEDDSNCIYIGHNDEGLSIFCLDSRRIVNYKHNPSDPFSIPSNNVTNLMLDKNGVLWVGTSKGLARYNKTLDNFETIELNSESPTFIYSINESASGKLWIGTDLEGVFILDNISANTEYISKINIEHGVDGLGLSAQSVRSILNDSFNNIWLGTYGGGVDFISAIPPLFNKIEYCVDQDLSSVLSNNVAWGLCSDKKGNLWIGTDGGGVDIFNGAQRVATLNSENSKLTDNCIISAEYDVQGKVWLGTYSGGLWTIDPITSKVEEFKLFADSKYSVRDIYEDKEGLLWICTNRGFASINSKNYEDIKYFSQENSQINDNEVRSIAKDNKGRLWVGTFGQGLSVFSPDMKLIKNFNTIDGFCSNTVNSIYCDKANNIWVATGYGLVEFERGVIDDYNVFNKESGLNNSNIKAIAEDTSGNIWISTNKGISCVFKNNKVQNYTHNIDGISDSFKSGSVTTDADGVIYFGSLSGLYYFSPERVITVNHSSSPVISSIQSYTSDSTINHNIYAGTITVDYDKNNLTISFSEDNLAMNGLVEYSYMLDGYSNIWFSPDKNNTATFFNLNPGKYSFKMKTRVVGGEWKHKGNMVDIVVKPSIWNSNVAFAIYGLLILIAIIFILSIYRNRIYWQSEYKLQQRQFKSESELNDERLRFYTNITHELRTPLTLIISPLEDLLNDSTVLPKHKTKLDHIYKSSHRLLKLVNQILKFRTVETQNYQLSVTKDNIAVVVSALASKYNELRSKKEVEFSLLIKDGDYSVVFDKEAITIILDNLISNAIKYTDKGSVKVTLERITRQNIDYIEITVKDTGCGIDKNSIDKIFNRFYQVRGKHQASGTGIGLALVKNLTELHQGEIKVDSVVGVGSRFTFTIVADNTYPNALYLEGEEVTNDELNNIDTLDFDDSGKPILLLVEDNLDICEYIKECMSDSFTVITATNGAEGVKLALDKIPDIIVSDIMMPIMTGTELCEKLKQNIKTSHIPIILLTAKDSASDKEQGYLIGADSYLTKPFNSTLLHSRINNLLESRRRIASSLINNTPIINDADNSNSDVPAINKIDNVFIEKVTLHIEANIQSEKVDVSSLATSMNLSNSTLYRKIKALTGLSPVEYIRKIKMRKAKQLLMDGNITVSEVAYMVGFNNIVYFRQCFKEEFKILPSQVIKSYNQES